MTRQASPAAATGGEEEPAGVARLVQIPGDPATAEIAVTVVDAWQGRGAGTALVSALLPRRPPAVTRLRAVVEAGNRAWLALLAGTGPMSAGLPGRGVLDVAVGLPAVSQPPGAVHEAAGLWVQGAQQLADQACVLFRLRQEGLIQAVGGCLQFVGRATDVNRDLTVRWILAASVPCRAGRRQIPHHGDR